MRGSRDRPTSAAAYSYPTAAPQPGRQYLQRGDLSNAAPLLTAGHALHLREQHPQPPPPGQATASLKRPSSSSPLAYAAHPPGVAGSAYAAFPSSHSSSYHSGSISAAAAGPAGAAAMPSPATSGMAAAATATGRRQQLMPAGTAAAAAASSAGAIATPAPSSSQQHQQHRAVHAIREQLHQLSVSAAASASASSSVAPRTSPTPSPLPGLSPRHSSDGGSDDGISDRAPSPSPSPLAMQHARTISAISAARLADRSSFPARSVEPPGQRSYAFTPSESDSEAALARGRGIAGPLITASLEPFQPTPSPSPLPPPGLSSPSPSPSPSPPQSRFVGSDSHALPVPHKSTALVSSTGSGASSLNETVIHVCDENRGIQQDFRCDRALLVAGMRYFASYLTVPSSTPNNPPHQDDIDISVHCDVLIFEWLLLWIAWERSVGLYDAILGPAKAAASKSAAAKSAASPKPSLDVHNVVSILISSDFLGMSRLVDECLAFVVANLAAVVRTPVDLACLSDELVRTMVLRHLADEIDGSLEAMRNDKEEAARVGHNRKHSAPTSSPFAGLQLLCGLRDRKSKISPRLWMFKTEALLAARSGTVGASTSSSLQQCAHCAELYWSSSSEGSGTGEALQFCASPLSRSRIDFHGVLHSRHVASRTWSARKWLLSLRVAESLEWEQIYWRVFGVVHATPNADDAVASCACEECGAKGFSYAALRSCRFHEKDAIMMKPTREAGSAVIASAAAQLTYPCCGTPAGLFASASGLSVGRCRVRVHELKPRGRKARALHEMALQHVDQICPQPDALSEADGASSDPAASPSSKKRVNIVLANNQTVSFGPGASTIKRASSAAAAPAILGPSVVAALASYSADAAPSTKPPPAVRRSLSSRRARALRGLDPDGASDDDAVAASVDDRSSAGSASDSDEDDGDDEEYEDEEEEDSDSDADRRRRGGAHRSHAAAVAKTPAARAAAAAERLRFKPGSESSNPHGHAPKRPVSQMSQRQQQRQQSQGRGSVQFESSAPTVLKLNSLAEKALSQLRDVMGESQFQLLHDQLVAGQHQLQTAQQQQTNRTTGLAFSSSQALSSASTTKVASRAPSAGSIRVASRKPQQSAESHKPSQQQQPPTRAVKSILKSPTGGAEVHIPSAAASSSGLHAFSAWDAASVTGPSVSRSPDGSPPRSPSKPKARSSAALDSAFEDDRQRMAAIITDLTHSRGAQQQAQVTNAAAAAAAAAHGRSASAAPSRVVDRGASAQARRPYK